MGGDPGRPLSLLEPAACLQTEPLAHWPRQAVEAVCIKHQQPLPAQQLTPTRRIGPAVGLAQAGPDQQGIQPLGIEFGRGIEAHHYLWVLLPDGAGQGLRQGGPDTAAAAAAGAGQGQAGGTPIGIAARHHQQSAALIFRCRRVEFGFRPCRQIPLRQSQGHFEGKLLQQRWRQAQVDPVQRPHSL